MIKFHLLDSPFSGFPSFERHSWNLPIITKANSFIHQQYERFIRPMGLRYKKANVTHPELGVTVQLPIISVKKNPQNPMYTQLGVLTKGTIIEVNVSELGIVTASGKVVWGRWAQITVCIWIIYS